MHTVYAVPHQRPRAFLKMLFRWLSEVTHRRFLEALLEGVLETAALKGE